MEDTEGFVTIFDCVDDDAKPKYICNIFKCNRFFLEFTPNRIRFFASTFDPALNPFAFHNLANGKAYPFKIVFIARL